MRRARLEANNDLAAGVHRLARSGDCRRTRCGCQGDAVQSLLVTTDRFGWHDELVQFARQMVLPFLPDDPRHVLPHWRCEIDRLRDGLAQQASRRG